MFIILQIKKIHFFFYKIESGKKMQYFESFKQPTLKLSYELNTEMNRMVQEYRMVFSNFYLLWLKSYFV